MNRIVRYMLMVLMSVASLATIGCEDLTKPKSDFYGYIRNDTQYRVFVSDPSNPTKIFRLDPGQGFYAQVPGSSVVHSEAKLQDGTLVGLLNGRINQISNDGHINANNIEVQVDWWWTIPGGFQP